MSGWLTVDDAAARVGRSKDTVYRWARRGLITIIGGRIAESQLLQADKEAQQRRGRPRATRERKQA